MCILHDVQCLDSMVPDPSRYLQALHVDCRALVEVQDVKSKTHWHIHTAVVACNTLHWTAAYTNNVECGLTGVAAFCDEAARKQQVQ